MKGHVRRRGGGWSFVVDVGKQPAQRCENCGHREWIRADRLAECPRCGVELDPPVLERRQRWQSGFSTKADAETAMRALLVEIERGADPLPVDISFSEYVEQWLDSARVRKLRPNTRRRYRQVLYDHALPLLGSMPLRSIRPRHVATVLEGVAEKGLQTRSVVDDVGAVVAGTLCALEAELVVANPVTAVRPPKYARRPLSVPTADQLAALIEEMRATPWEMPFLLAATTGMRRSEALGLRWEYVDLGTGRVRVVATMQRVRDEYGSRIELLDCKTDRSRREITLPELTASRLRTWKVEQNERRLKLGPAWSDLDLVCDRGDGRPPDPDAFGTAFKRAARKAGLPTATRLHDVRHAFATTLLERRVHPAIASAVLGHSSTAFTMNTYQHVLDGMTQAAADAIDDVFGDPGEAGASE
ncbi:MAG: tyrosine-type recombinase/integrase [Acidimicrobiia bacterium]|nr:tyrosine-type recombinase/integrase [Acidimicrobiia bacterium]